MQDVEYYNKLEDPTDEENDMLDLAFGLCETWVNLEFNFHVLFMFLPNSSLTNFKSYADHVSVAK